MPALVELPAGRLRGGATAADGREGRKRRVPVGGRAARPAVLDTAPSAARSTTVPPGCTTGAAQKVSVDPTPGPLRHPPS